MTAAVSFVLSAVGVLAVLAFVIGICLLAWRGTDGRPEQATLWTPEQAKPWWTWEGFRSRWELRPEDRRSLGGALLTGAVLTLALTALQLYLDDKRREDAKEEQFKLTVSAAHDLTGFDPEFPLAGMTLSGKILDRAPLSGDDLSSANLAGASLRDASLDSANLEDADLSRADLTGAVLWDADLRGADLRFADLNRAQLLRPNAAKNHLDLHGAMVNARTCWPAFLLATGRLRGQLTKEKTIVSGQTKADESFGNACGLSYVDLLRHFGEPQPIRVEDIASKLGVRPRRVLDVLEAGGLGSNPALGPGAAPAVARVDLCAGAQRALVRNRPAGGSSVLLVAHPKRRLGSTLVIFRPEVQPRLKPLEPGTRVTLVATRPGDETPTYQTTTRVRRC